MHFICTSPVLADYLCEHEVVDYSHPLIQETAYRLRVPEASPVEQISATFAFVRDTIPHSWDIQCKQLTRRASEVLQQKTGMCYAKAHLLAALLRAQGTPAGFCYQRLTRGDTPESGYVIHGLNAVYVSSIQKWVRLDARGNKPGVQTEFSLEGERLAYSVRPELGEIDYPTIYAQPHPTTIKVLQEQTDCLYMMQHCLPDRL